MRFLTVLFAPALLFATIDALPRVAQQKYALRKSAPAQVTALTRVMNVAVHDD